MGNYNDGTLSQEEIAANTFVNYVALDNNEQIQGVGILPSGKMYVVHHWGRMDDEIVFNKMLQHQKSGVSSYYAGHGMDFTADKQMTYRTHGSPFMSRVVYSTDYEENAIARGGLGALPAPTPEQATGALARLYIFGKITGAEFDQLTTGLSLTEEPSQKMWREAERRPNLIRETRVAAIRMVEKIEDIETLRTLHEFLISNAERPAALGAKSKSPEAAHT